MIEARFVRLQRWPRPITAGRKRSPFDAPFSETLRVLERELKYLRAKDILFQTWHAPADIRQDGWPRSSARKPCDPGVILTAGKTAVGPQQWACDRFDDYEDNIRAIALGLEALRRVDRYGITKSGEQYRGFAALPAPPSASDHAATLRRHAKVAPDFPIRTAVDVEIVYRSAAMATHPDRGGDPKAFQTVTEARDALLREVTA